MSEEPGSLRDAQCWVPGAVGSGFGVEHLPYGVFAHGAHGDHPGDHPGVRVGDFVLPLDRAEREGVLGRLDAAWFQPDVERPASLNRFLAAGPAWWRAVRQRLTELFTDPAHRRRVEPMLVPLADVAMQLPFTVADYVDFYSSINHASNVGEILRPGQASLQPNWRHLPVGYHGRAGTVAVSGTPVRRPSGQRRPSGADKPEFGPSLQLDIEAEVGFVVGAPSAFGRPVPADDFARHVFGVLLVNDWSARDIQAWEYQPLGPFLGKSFLTSVGGWVTPIEALEAARVPAAPQDPPTLPYLAEADRFTYDLALEVEWNGTVVSRPPFASLYWTPAQQLAHLTVNGAHLRTGDLYASGTVSGPRRDQVGSFLELSWGGREPVRLADGSERTFLEDGDAVVIRATAPGPGGTTIRLGEVTGTIGAAEN